MRHRQVKRLMELIELKTTAFSRSSRHHEYLLQRLWTGIFPGDPIEGRISEKWKLLGFQVGATGERAASLGASVTLC